MGLILHRAQLFLLKAIRHSTIHCYMTYYIFLNLHIVRFIFIIIPMENSTKFRYAIHLQPHLLLFSWQPDRIKMAAMFP